MLVSSCVPEMEGIYASSELVFVFFNHVYKVDGVYMGDSGLCCCPLFVEH